MQSQSTWYLQNPDDGLQFMKEEKTDDAIYSIYLKKIRYNSSKYNKNRLSFQDTNSRFDNMPIGEDNSGQHIWQMVEVRFIKFATIEILVKNLGSGSGEIDMSYVSTFLTTYRTFTTGELVLDLIIFYYRSAYEIVEQEEQIFYQRTLKLVLSIWLEQYQEDFNKPPTFSLIHSMLDFALEIARDDNLTNKILNMLTLFTKGESSNSDNCFIELLYPLKIEFFDIELERHTKHFSEQLTLIDAELFKNVILHECLGSNWSRRHEPGGAMHVRTVMATINQFNDLTNRVVADILKPEEMSKRKRANIIEWWIFVAQELRALKNFSSLKAIISALQSNSIYRLFNVWSFIKSDVMKAFIELTELLSEENNHNLLRQIIYQEGTSKHMISTKHNKSTDWMCGYVGDTKNQENQRTVGTIPYLGTFLTDLTMLDAAFVNHKEDDPRLINFEKMKKEYDILTHIKLLQSAANCYTIRKDEAFIRIFNAMPTISESQSYEFSCKIDTELKKYNTLPIKGNSKHVRRKSISALINKLGSLGISNQDNLSTYSHEEIITDRSSICSEREKYFYHKNLKRTPVYPTPWAFENKTLAMRVHMPDTHPTNDYKSIMVFKNESINTAIKRALKKFDMGDDFRNYDMYIQGKEEIKLMHESNVDELIKTSNNIIDVVLKIQSNNIISNHK